MTFKDRRGPLIRWLLGKGIHPQDAASAIKWCEETMRAGRPVKDRDVLAKAMECQIEAVDRYEGAAPNPLVVHHEWHWTWQVGVSAFIGSIAGGLAVGLWE